MKIWRFSQAWKSRFQFVVFGIWSKTRQDTASDLIVLCHLTVSFCCRISGYLCFLLGILIPCYFCGDTMVLSENMVPQNRMVHHHVSMLCALVKWLHGWGI